MGIVHPPGYPLYLLLAHLFTLLPFGDIGYRVNLFSAVCLALTAPLLYALLRELVQDRWSALAAALIFVWSYPIWGVGVVAEIYAPQILTLTVTGWALVRLYARRLDPVGGALIVGLLYGLAVATVPSSALFAPGLVVAFLLLRIPLRACIVAAILALVVFALALLYFPLRAHDPTTVILAGEYDAQGVLRAYHFSNLSEILWFVSGQPFRWLFFQDGYLPSAQRLGEFLSLLWSNYLGFGLLIAAAGLGALYKHSRLGLIALLAFFVPYTYFYICYGAADRNMMFGPSLLILTVPLAFGMMWFTRTAPPSLRTGSALVLPLIFFVVNFAQVDLSHDTHVRDQSISVMAALPRGALVFGDWWQIMPLTYVQLFANPRTDIALYNDTLSTTTALNRFLQSALDKASRPVVILSGAEERIDLSPLASSGHYDIEPFILAAFDSTADSPSDNDQGIIVRRRNA